MTTYKYTNKFNIRHNKLKNLYLCPKQCSNIFYPNENGNITASNKQTSILDR